MKRHLLAALALLLFSSPLFAVDDPEQLKTLKQAAESGDVSAQYEVGVLYEFGYRMKTHLIPALAWYMVAADNGNVRAIKRRDYLMSQLTPEQVEEAKRYRAGLSVKKPAERQPADEMPAPAPATEAPAPAPAKPAEPAAEKPKPETAPAPVAKPAEPKPDAAPAKPAEKKPEPKPDAAPPADEGPTVQPLPPPRE